ncbi:hypothetical protein D3C85_756820 [compost metagenome]
MLSLIPRLAPYRYIEIPEVPGGVYSTTRTKQAAFATNEPIEDVKEQFFVAVGGASIANQRYRTSAGGQYLGLDEHGFGNEDFTVQMKMRFDAAPGSFGFIGAQANLLGTDATGSWMFVYEYPSYLSLFWRDATNTQRAIRAPCPAALMTANVDHHFEVGRSGNTIYLFLDGALLGTGTQAGPTRPQVANMTKLTMSQPQTVQGYRWDVAIDRGICLHTAPFTPAALPVLARPEYSAADAKLIRAQFEFRRDSIVNEANGAPIYVKGSSSYNFVANGRLNCIGTTSVNNNWQMAIEPFGAADFTIEHTIKVTGTPALSSLILGHIVNAASTTVNNRWYFLLSSNRRLSFVMRNSETLATTVSVTVPINLTIGVSYKFIVERYNNVLTMYLLDALTGELLGTNSAAASLPIQSAKPFLVTNYVISGDRNLTSAHTIWDIRIADKAMYQGAPYVPATFPAVPLPKYTTAEEAAIVSQVSLRRSTREEKTNAPIPMAAPVVVLNNSLNVPVGSTDFAITPPEYFGAGDFTLECRLMFNATTNLTCYLLGQFDTTNNSSWCIRTTSTRLQFVFSKTGAGTGALDTVLFTLAVPTAWVAGVEYFLVCERVGDTTTFYLDGVAVATTTAINFPLFNSTRSITRGFGGSSGSADYRLRDMRISKVAQYAGVVPVTPTHKRFAGEKPSIVAGYTVGGTGTLWGYMETSLYATDAISLGSCSHKLFVDSSNPVLPVVKRLKGLFVDRGAYLIIGWEDTTLAPTADMPKWSNVIVIDGVQINLAGAPVSGFSTPIGGTSVYVGAAPMSSPADVGRQISFEFL